MHRVFCAAILVTVCALQSHAQSSTTISADDHTVVPGQRVGAITLYSSLSILQGLYGTKNVKPKMQPLPSGDTTPGVRLFDGTDLQLDILWDEEGRDKRAVEVRLTGSTWALQNGLKTGLSIDEVAKINGKSFKINGFDWNYGGYASFDGGALAEGQGVRFAPTVANYKRSLVGDKKLSSTDSDLRAATPVVTQIAIWLR